MPGHAAIVSSSERKLELETVLALVEEVREQALPSVRKEFLSLSKHLRLALPYLLLFAADLDAPQLQAEQRLGPEAVRLIAWAWQRRAVLGPSITDLVASFDPTWRERRG